MEGAVNRAMSRGVHRAFGVHSRSLLPTTGLLAWIVDETDSAGLSISDYDKIGSTFQATFFLDANTPIIHTPAEWSAILSVHVSINLLNVMGAEDKGWAVYDSTTSREILNKALRFFGLSQIYSYLEMVDELEMIDELEMTE